MDKPTGAGHYWFIGKIGLWRNGRLLHPNPFEGPVFYDGRDVDILASDELYDVEDFEGEFIPLNGEIVRRGQRSS